MNMNVSGCWGVGLYKFEEDGQISSTCFIDPEKEMKGGVKVDPRITIVPGEHRSLLVTYPSQASCTFKKIKV
jgi:hypothetical protein